MNRPRLVVFDMAGTTVDDRGAVNRCFRDALAAVGLVADPSAVDAVMGLPKPEAIAILIRDHGRTADLGPKIGAVHDDFVARMIGHYEGDPSVGEVPGIAGLFERLAGVGVLVALDTGFGRAIVDVILRRLGWSSPAGPVASSVASDEVPRGRPHPDMIRHLMGRLGVPDPAAVAKVGDAPADLLEGTNAGCGWVVGVTWGTHSRDGLAAYPHTALVDLVAELAPALGL